MTSPRAADLPQGTKVIIGGHEYQRVAPHLDFPWHSPTAKAVYSDDGIDDAIRNGAAVLREGLL